MTNHMTTLPVTHQDLLEQPVVVTIATVSEDGQPYTAVVWRRWDGGIIRIVTDPKTRKYRNIKTNAKVSVTAVDPQNPYRYLVVNGIVETIVDDVQQTTAELDAQTKLYTGKEHYFGDIEPAENRAKATYVTLLIKPARYIKVGSMTSSI
jgi:PPOX class probable F420-dependent enzyme